MKLKGIIEKFNEENVEEEKKNGTFKCPDCGSKVLKNTAYCVKCKKKVDYPTEGEGDAQ
jgi:DNA-directed RNA polymerase subunit RPC12/RpoP